MQFVAACHTSEAETEFTIAVFWGKQKKVLNSEYAHTSSSTELGAKTQFSCCTQIQEKYEQELCLKLF